MPRLHAIRAVGRPLEIWNREAGKVDFGYIRGYRLQFAGSAVIVQVLGVTEHIDGMDT